MDKYAVWMKAYEADLNKLSGFQFIRNAETKHGGMIHIEDLRAMHSLSNVELLVEPVDMGVEKGLAGCVCDECHNEYFIDVFVDDFIWSKISPKVVDGYKTGGLLCPQCIVNKLSKFIQPTIQGMEKAVATGLFTKEQENYVASVRDEDLRAHLLHQVRVSDNMESDRNNFEAILRKNKEPSKTK